MVIQETKVTWAPKDLEDTYMMHPKAQGAHLAIQVFQAHQVILVTLANNAIRFSQEPTAM